jgi:hypothetical protein
MQWKNDNYLISTSYWAKGIPRDTMKKALDGSLFFGLYVDGKQIGLSRMITDNATFAYLVDVLYSKNIAAKG